MSGAHQIADVAERRRFTPATSRHDEEIGLTAPVRRTDAGHRLHDDAASCGAAR